MYVNHTFIHLRQRLTKFSDRHWCFWIPRSEARAISWTDCCWQKVDGWHRDWCKRELGWESLYSTNRNATVRNFYRIYCRNDMRIFICRFKGSDDYLRAKVSFKPCPYIEIEPDLPFFLVRRIYHGCAFLSKIPRFYYQRWKQWCVDSRGDWCVITTNLTEIVSWSYLLCRRSSELSRRL